MFFWTQTYLTADTDIEKEVTNKMKAIDKIKSELLELFDKYWANILGAILIYFIGRKIVKFLEKLIKKALDKSSIEITVCKFLNRIISIILNTILIISIMGCLGVQTTSFIAILGSAGLAVGLSLQGSLANFAGGVLILLLKPFKVNDYIITNNVEGTVRTIDIFYTKIVTPDYKKIVIPNGVLTNSVIQTVPEVSKRRIDLEIPVSYDSDIKKIRDVLTKVAERNEKVKFDSGVSVVVQAFEASDILIGFKVWVATSDYIVAKGELLEEIIYAFRKNNISIPFDQLDVNLITENHDNNVFD